MGFRQVWLISRLSPAQGVGPPYQLVPIHRSGLSIVSWAVKRGRNVRALYSESGTLRTNRPSLDGPRRVASPERRRGARPWLSSPVIAAREGRTTPMPDTPEAILEGRKRPFTGAEYLQSLRDGR